MAVLSQVARRTLTGWGRTNATNADVVAGLKEALTKGAEHSVSVASVTDGFWKNSRLRIPFPPEAVKVKNTLNDLGMSAQVEKFEMTMNRAAGASPAGAAGAAHALSNSERTTISAKGLKSRRKLGPVRTRCFMVSPCCLWLR